MAHVDESTVQQGEPDPAPRRPGKSPTSFDDALDAFGTLAEQEQAAQRPNRKARRVALSKRKGDAHRGKRHSVGEQEHVLGDHDHDGAGDDHRDDDDASPRLSPAEVLKLITSELSVSPEIAGAALGVGRNTSYEAIHKGQITAVRVGNKLVCPTAPLRRQLGLEPRLPGEEPMPRIAKQKKQETIKAPKRRR